MRQGLDTTRLRAEYAAMTDEALAELHARGPDAYASAEAWRLVDEEFRSRGTAGESAETAFLETQRIEMETGESSAPLLPRLGAAAIDTILAFSPAIVLSVLVAGPDALFTGVLLVSVVGYWPLCEGKWATTVGKRIMGLRVVDLRGQAPSFGTVCARALLRPITYARVLRVLFSGPPLWHDVVTNTRVISSRREPAGLGSDAA